MSTRLFMDIRQTLEYIKGYGDFTYMDDAPNDLVHYEEHVEKLLQAVDLAFEALEALYNDHKSEFGIHDDEILIDTSSLGQAKGALAKIKSLSEGKP